MPSAVLRWINLLFLGEIRNVLDPLRFAMLCRGNVRRSTGWSFSSLEMDDLTENETDEILQR